MNKFLDVTAATNAFSASGRKVRGGQVRAEALGPQHQVRQQERRGRLRVSGWCTKLVVLSSTEHF